MKLNLTRCSSRRRRLRSGRPVQVLCWKICVPTATNGLNLRQQIPEPFRFGGGSFASHRILSSQRAAVACPGLSGKMFRASSSLKGFWQHSSGVASLLLPCFLVGLRDQMGAHVGHAALPISILKDTTWPCTLCCMIPEPNPPAAFLPAQGLLGPRHTPSTDQHALKLSSQLAERL